MRTNVHWIPLQSHKEGIRFLHSAAMDSSSIPLSLYLFVLCQEALSRIINRALSLRRIKGVEVSRGSPEISHLMYADDVVLFYKASLREVLAMIKCLGKHFEWSGQAINKEIQGGSKDQLGKELWHGVQKI